MKNPWLFDFKNGELACPDSSLNQIKLCSLLFNYFFESIIPMRGVQCYIHSTKRSDLKKVDSIFTFHVINNFFMLVKGVESLLLPKKLWLKSFRLMASIDLKDILIASHVDTFDSQRINFIISIWPKVVFLGTCALCTGTKNTTKKSSPKYCNRVCHIAKSVGINLSCGFSHSITYE